MTIVKAKEYYEIIASFCRKHELYKVENGELKDNCYIKKYLCEDGSQGTEVNRKVYEKVSVEVKGVKCEAVVELLETEWFDSDSGKSIYMYERYQEVIQYV